ncbi:Ion channel CASTOR [Glycine soja]|uniref:Ion channel CASTOR n=1 Tax=Glycine soja TaxID=3848 RepID=A0A445LHG8_GLYSO|nr:Ion channel CASTOR [Glycine soja]
MAVDSIQTQSRTLLRAAPLAFAIAAELNSPGLPLTTNLSFPTLKMSCHQRLRRITLPAFRNFVSVSKARAIIVLAEDGNADQSDARALRTVLSLTGVKEGLRGHIVVELSDLDNEVLVKLVGGDLVENVVAHVVIGRLMIQCARQPELAQLEGMQFEDVLISFPAAIPCGIKIVSYGGKIILNPDDSYVLQEGDEVLVIAEDDDTYAPASLPTILILADESVEDSAIQADSRSHATLLLIREIQIMNSHGEELNFYEIMLRARQRRETVIGYRLANAERAVINPPAKTDRQKWSLKDVFVVITEKE